MTKERKFLALLGVILIILGLLVSSCDGQTAYKPSEYQLNFEHIGRGVQRIENKEVICYYIASVTIDCKFKGK